MSRLPSPPSRGRRRFLRDATLAGLAAAAAPAAAFAQAAGRRRPAAKPEPPAPPPAEASEVSADARAIAGVIERRHGGHLTSEQLAAVTEDVERNLQLGKRLRETKLRNADEPDVAFRA
jgi:hypothetical protein